MTVRQRQQLNSEYIKDTKESYTKLLDFLRFSLQIYSSKLEAKKVTVTDMQTKKFIQSSVLFGSNHYLFYEIFCANQLRGPKAYHDGHKDMFIGIQSCTFMEKHSLFCKNFCFTDSWT